VTVVVVVVPVHNEEELLGRCLTALGAAVSSAAARGIRCVVRIVLDDCTDGSRQIAQMHPFPTMEVAAARVGHARARGVEAAMRELGRTPAQRVWIANTDADSAVPANWIVAQCELAAAGADVFIGTVRPDFADLSSRHRRHWLRTHSTAAPNGHIHGASLGIRADVYAAAGGFEAVEAHEDVGLVERCRLLGAKMRASATAEVLTSGRLVGRTPGGYADYLRAQAEVLGSQSR
jgi:glycosyltransferase involved in cell wall biosynthesis